MGQKIKAVAQKFGTLPAKPAPSHKPLHGTAKVSSNAMTSKR